VWRNAAAAEHAYQVEPLHHYGALWPEAVTWALRNLWESLVPCAPKMVRSIVRTREVWARSERLPSAPPQAADPQKLTDEIRAEAARVGLSAVGFAPYDEKYTFAEAQPLETGSVIVCVLEQDWELTQVIPSGRTERHALETYYELAERASLLAEFLHRKGYRAQPHGTDGTTIVIHYGVEAGLGQLGLNGQLLTPQAGSRCRLSVITTNAQLIHSGPVDYGMHAICDQCQLCIKRCPPGAIPLKRREHRGIVKAPIKIDRCMPVVAQSHGCGVCMKVCPIQRYGLEQVTDHLMRTGTILGKGSDELEGYVWVNGRHYGPGEKPRIDADLIHPPDLVLDPSRTRPQVGAAMSNMVPREVSEEDLRG
jgi:ferredoxin